MGWIEDISEAIRYIEENITEKLQIEDISAKACLSAYYFQKGFSMLCGMTVIAPPGPSAGPEIAARPYSLTLAPGDTATFGFSVEVI